MLDQPSVKTTARPQGPHYVGMTLRIQQQLNNLSCQQLNNLSCQQLNNLSCQQLNNLSILLNLNIQQPCKQSS